MRARPWAGSDLRIGVIATNTVLAGAAGSIMARLYMWLRYGKPDPSMVANGALAGLVAITAPCAFVTAPSAVLIGGIAGVLVCWSVIFFDRTLRIDDPVGAISVHGVNGMWGCSLWACWGDPSQFMAQVVGVGANIIGVGALTLLAWYVTSLVTQGHRVSAEVEDGGLDLPEMGVLAYPEGIIAADPSAPLPAMLLQHTVTREAAAT
jgi:ammonium transporter, Amt family